MRFVWDAEKNRRNKAKHKLAFDTATLVFDDPNALSRIERLVEGEERWQTMGLVRHMVLVVAHTIIDEEGDEVIRIISARRATRKERMEYEEAQ